MLAINTKIKNIFVAHQNCVLFITHGGLLSITEAIHFGVPLIGLPFFSDQPNNMNRVVKKGFGKQIPFDENIAANLNDTIIEMLTNYYR